MEALTRISVVAATSLILGTVGAQAASPVALTDRQLDGVTAGVSVFGSSDAASAGVFSLSTTTGNSFVTQGPSPYSGNPDLGSSGGVSEGTALAVGTNLGVQGSPPASSATSVTTSCSAQGNFVVNTTVNHTVQ